MVYKRDDAFTGLEAAIVLIAFVVVAAVFSYVVLGAGFFTTQKSQETVYKGVEQATSNIQMLGQVYGINESAAAEHIDKIQFTIGLAPGAPSVDLDAMTIIYSAPDVTPRTYSLDDGGNASDTKFSAHNQANVSVSTMAAGDQITVAFKTGTDNERSKGQKINIELRPGVGAALPFTKTMPATVSQVNVLY